MNYCVWWTVDVLLFATMKSNGTSYAIIHILYNETKHSANEINMVEYQAVTMLYRHQC